MNNRVTECVGLGGRWEREQGVCFKICIARYDEHDQCSGRVSGGDVASTIGQVSVGKTHETRETDFD